MKLLILDGNSIINRAFYAIPHLSAPSGLHTGGIYGFLVTFLKTLNNATDILKEEKVIRIIAVTVIKKYGKRTTDEVSTPLNP